MYSVSILPEQIREFEYYKNKLPLFLQNSYGFIEHFRIWYDLLTSDEHTGLADNCDIILYLLNIFDEDYLDFIASLDGSGAELNESLFRILNNEQFGEGADHPHIPDSESGFRILNDAQWGQGSSPLVYNQYGDVSDILDKIGLLFGVSRAFSCTYKNQQGVIVTEELNLNNEDFLILIKGEIIRNYCEGTAKQIEDYYLSAGLKIFMKNDDPYAAVRLYLISEEGDEYSSDIKKMFAAGMLNIDSMGILYTYQVVEVGEFLRWDGIGLHEVWDVGVWAE